MNMMVLALNAVSMNIIIFSTALVAIVGLAIGIFLGFSSEIFKVEVDEKVTKVRECLPGNNCGGCGYAGCDAVAEAIVSGKAPANACPVGGAPVAEKIGEVLGVSVGSSKRMAAFVHCNGTCVNANKKYSYNGVKDCRVASSIPNAGEKACAYACLGYGECVKACKFDAIHIVDGVALVDSEKCKACGACVKACPMHLIELLPADKKHVVLCSNKDKGKPAMDACKVSCIACGMCERTCTKDAIHVTNNIAVMDFEKCTDCGACATKCPRKAIS